VGAQEKSEGAHQKIFGRRFAPGLCPPLANCFRRHWLQLKFDALTDLYNCVIYTKLLRRKTSFFEERLLFGLWTDRHLIQFNLEDCCHGPWSDSANNCWNPSTSWGAYFPLGAFYPTGPPYLTSKPKGLTKSAISGYNVLFNSDIIRKHILVQYWENIIWPTLANTS